MIKLTKIAYVCVNMIICVSLQILCLGQCYGEGNAPKKHLLKEDSSPNGNIIIRYYDDGARILPYGDIWLYSKKNHSKKALLFSYERDADILISPDEKWIVINYRYGSDVTDALLFKQVKGLEYEETRYLDLMAWDLFRKTHKQYKIPKFGHSYAEAVIWSSDSKSVLIYIYGHHDDSPKKLEPWYCIYDVTTGKMTLDFDRVFNRDTYHPNGKPKGRKLYKY